MKRLRLAPGAVLALLAAAGLHPLVGQESGGGWGYADAAHPVCRAWIHAWAAGAVDDPGLATYGTSFALRYVADRSSSRESVAGREAARATARGALEGLVTRRRREALALGAALGGSRGPVLAGTNEPTDTPDVFRYEGPRTGRGFTPALRVRGDLGLGALRLVGDVEAGRGRRVVRTLGLGLAVEPMLALAGVLAARTGPSCSPGLVLGAGDRAEVRGLELVQRRPFRLPLAGATRVGLQVGFLAEAGPGNRRPFFHSMRIELHPHRDWVIGLNRAAIFGGSATSIPVTPRTVALMLLGIPDTPGKDSDFENQVASVDVRWRSRLGARPTLLTLEYGTEDSGRAFVRVPGLRLAGEVPVRITGSGWAGLELVWMAGSRRPHPPWYHHGALSWGWTDRGRPLGDPLGGHGLAALATYRAESPRGGLDLSAGVAWRGNENLFAPDLEGRGIRGSATWQRSFGAWEISSSARVDVADALAGAWSISLLRRLVGGR